MGGHAAGRAVHHGAVLCDDHDGVRAYVPFVFLRRAGADVYKRQVQADTGSKADIVSTVSRAPELQHSTSLKTEVVETQAGEVAFEISEMDDVFSVDPNFTQRTDSAGQLEPMGEKSPSGHSSRQQSFLQPQPQKNAETIRAEGGKPSVKQELDEIKQERCV